MAALTFSDFLDLLSGRQPLPANGSVGYSLPLSHSQLQELVPLLQEHQQLRGLKLRGCRLDDVAAEALVSKPLSSFVVFN